MKDSVYELINAIVTLFGSTLTYENYIFDVYEDLPNYESNNYVWFPSAVADDESNQDTHILHYSITIRVVTKGLHNKASRKAISAIGSIILTALMHQDITMTSYETVRSDLISINHSAPIDERGGQTLMSDYTFEIVTEQT